MAIPADEQLRDGVAIIDKGAGWTSHDVVAKARGILHNKKVGHAGTLDPDATGVLVLGVGRATRLLRFLTALSKTYVGEFVLGAETTTLDASGEITATYDMAAVTADEVRRAAGALTGPILQVPPMVSAVKIDGRRLHTLARRGEEIDRPPRPVMVHRFAVDSLPGESLPGESLSGDRRVWRAEVVCSSGTYVRTLAADLGRALGGGAYLRTLQRTAIGSFSLAAARSLDDIEVLPAAEAMRDYPFVVVDGETAAAVAYGKVLEAAAVGIPTSVVLTRPGVAGAETGPWAVLDGNGALLAVYEAHRGTTIKPAVVIAPAQIAGP
jgi:tRNA pseudouridine55 synthase